MSGASVPADRRRHDADGAGASDQHVLADQVEGERRVGGVSKRVQDRGDVICDDFRQDEHVAGRNNEVFGETTLTVDAHADGVSAQMTPAGPAIATMAAGDMTFP
jgi:hypothetical protein